MLACDENCCLEQENVIVSAEAESAGNSCKRSQHLRIAVSSLCAQRLLVII